MVPKLGFLCYFRSLVCGVQLPDTEYSVRTPAGRSRNTKSQFPSGDLGCWHWRRSPLRESFIRAGQQDSNFGSLPQSQSSNSHPVPLLLLVTCGFSNSRILTPWVGLYSVMPEDYVIKLAKTVFTLSQGPTNRILAFSISARGPLRCCLNLRRSLYFFFFFWRDNSCVNEKFNLQRAFTVCEHVGKCGCTCVYFYVFICLFVCLIFLFDCVWAVFEMSDIQAKNTAGMNAGRKRP